MTRSLREERGDAALIGCVGLAAFFLLLGFAVIDYWSTLSSDRNLQAIAQDAADAGASGIDIDAYRDNGVVQLDPDTACFMVDITGASITVILHEEVGSLVLEVAGHHALPITVSATSTATASAY